MASGEPAGCKPATPMSMSTAPGRRASTAAALGSSTATQPGPLSAQARSMMSARLRPRIAAMCSASGSSTGPDRMSGGAAKASPAGTWRISTRPAPHSWMNTSGRAGFPPDSSQAWQVPRVGWPANGSSRLGVKIRTW